MPDFVNNTGSRNGDAERSREASERIRILFPGGELGTNIEEMVSVGEIRTGEAGVCFRARKVEDVGGAWL